MPVLKKTEHHALMTALASRYDALVEALESRPLKSASEGVKGRGHWVNPEDRCATKGSEMDVRLAVEDFKAVLAEVKALK